VCPSSSIKHDTTSRKVGGSIPDGVILIFYWHNLSGPHCGRGVDLVSNTNEYQEYLLKGKGDRCIGLTTLPLSGADFLEIWEPQPPGKLRASPGLLYLSLHSVPAITTFMTKQLVPQIILFMIIQSVPESILTFKNRASYIYSTGVPLPSRCCILYIFLINISTEYFKHAAHSPFFSSK